MNNSVSILAEIPEELHLSMQGYLEVNPEWDQDRVFSAAISLFLLQNTVENSPEASRNYRRAAQVYLETLFRSGGEGPPELGTESLDLKVSDSENLNSEALASEDSMDAIGDRRMEDSSPPPTERDVA